MNSFLITFKPQSESPERGWALKSLRKLAWRMRRNKGVIDPWRFRNQKDVSVGDRAFLLMQGKRGPAIIGYGQVKGGCGANCRKIKFEELVDPDTDEALLNKAQLLTIHRAAQWWKVPFSGVRLPQPIAAALENLLAVGKPKRLENDTLVREFFSRDDGITEASEGARRLREIYTPERNRGLVEAKLRESIRQYGKLACEVCDVDFVALYGSLGNGVIECHHIKQVKTFRHGHKTHINDLALLCANCHRVLHKGNKTIATLRSLVRRRTNN